MFRTSVIIETQPELNVKHIKFVRQAFSLTKAPNGAALCQPRVERSRNAVKRNPGTIGTVSKSPEWGGPSEGCRI